MQDAIAEYRRDYIESNTTENPVLGKLVLVAELRLALADSAATMNQRIESASQITGALVGSYPHYGAGLAARAAVLSLVSDLHEFGPLGPRALSPDDADEVELLLSRLAVEDPTRFQVLRLQFADLPEDLAWALAAKTKAFQPAHMAIEARQALGGSPLSNREIEAALQAFARDMERASSDVFRATVLATVERERAVRHAMKRAVSHCAILASGRSAASETDPQRRWRRQVEAAAVASAAGLPHVSEAWLERAQIELDNSTAKTLDLPGAFFESAGLSEEARLQYLQAANLERMQQLKTLLVIDHPLGLGTRVPL